MYRLKTYSDGGARGNPGPAAAAYLIVSDTDEVLGKGSRFIGKRTNNQAEYEALIAALEAAAALSAREVRCHLDSELVGKHLSGKYKVKSPELLKLWKKANDLSCFFRTIEFITVPRTNSFIQQADRLVNETLDRVSGKTV